MNHCSKIEITPEMIESGAAEVRFFDRENDDPAETAASVFKAMIAAWGSKKRTPSPKPRSHR